MRVLVSGFVAVSLALSTLPASADMFGTKSRRDLFKNQTKFLDTRGASQYENSVRLRPPTAKPSASEGSFSKRYTGKYRGQYMGMAREAARRHNVPEELFLRLVQQESNWNPGARSHKGAMGLAQLMPQTARSLGVNPRDPYQNLDGGARYLSIQFREFRSWRLALAAYNAGPQAVHKHGGIPPYKETRNYVKKIWGG